MLKKILSWLTIIIFSCTLTACNDTIDSVQAFNSDSKPPIPKVENIAEVAPPELIQQLNQNFATSQPQVKILTPNNGEVLNTKDVSVTLDIKGLDIFKDEELQMGPHLHFFIDDKPYQAIYTIEKPIILSDLTPGTHTIRVFASRPWHESFKNEGAYAQTTFHVFTPTEDNNPSDSQPLLTYSRPQGVYGAQPIMLDFYLTNAPLHVVAKENPNDDIPDWRIRVTVNGESFLLDTWQPIYLTGFNKGQNWVKLEFIDENGDVIKNAFNSTVRAIEYDPKIKDTLAKLVTGKISLNKAQAITIRNYKSAEEEVILEKEVTKEEKIIDNIEESLPTLNTEEKEVIKEEEIVEDIPIETPKIETKTIEVKPELNINETQDTITELESINQENKTIESEEEKANIEEKMTENKLAI
ncbi:MAG: hypothetical protein GW795_06635 [Cyanobacteria bacterium]|nr:hypothetical protein [Cyanobacteria bacterium CG_2015-16_32_12]NCO77106.1 hypothetical protein [Cyanobacteria bacterium CG_2015-22_32_23]NCQ04151.1 hypothetical protein [Cyanobacteria bacterium CG_2015-09_32_10]NCQ41558.1 hypothetical protein [Cyanobacteria bacterium CG_2015-04_32_10]NCS84914.1 hypothetical protein [Cyanobacteria bacterium CG_2015-02_32_10]